MEFNSYIDWINFLTDQGFKEIVFGVKDNIKNETLYIEVADSRSVGTDNMKWVIGYTYNVVFSVESVDNQLLEVLARALDTGPSFGEWSENSRLYNYTGSVYIPVGSGGQPWQQTKV